MSDLALAIDESLGKADWEASVEGVRNAVINEVKALDPDVHIRGRTALPL